MDIKTKKEMSSYKALMAVANKVFDDNVYRIGLSLEDIHLSHEPDNTEMLTIVGNHKVITLFTTRKNNTLYTPYVRREISPEDAYQLIINVCYE